ncbi:hypothetical protein ACORE2_12970 [Bacillus thuringiensis]|uniref:hypothetical protein n=1 Tax=Bacillus thuringiensis TaxID=1428 RepID=UPI003BAECA36
MKKLLNYLTEIKFSDSKGLTPNDFEHRAIFIGIIAEMLLSKRLFPRNEDLKNFIKSAFNLEILDYVYRSRTLLLARIIRRIEKAEKETLTEYVEQTYSYIKKLDVYEYTNVTQEYQMNESKQEFESIKKKNKKKSTIDTIESWRKVINRDYE